MPIFDNSGHKKIESRTTEDPEELLKQIFWKHDKDKDKLLSKEELKKAFNELGSRWPGARAWLGIQAVDANGDGCIGENEMNALVKYAMKVGYDVK